MGAATSSTSAVRNDHIEILSSLGERREDRVIHRYSNGFSGFAARLSEEEAQSIARRPGVVSVFPDPVLKLHTTRSQDILNYQFVKIKRSRTSKSKSSSLTGADTIIGIFDTGISPELKSFSDEGFGPIPSRWKGTCMEAPDFNASNCNRKLIGARYYNNTNPDPYGTPRDRDGHGTHVAAIAAGNPVQGASYHGLVRGSIKGASPGSRIAVYNICNPLGGCYGSAVLKAFQDAIADGVDIVSLTDYAQTDVNVLTDPVAIGAYHAVENGILVVGVGGDHGPEPESVVNPAPWILTVAATTTDRFFESDVVLGGNKVIKGGGIHFANIQKSPKYPLIYGLSAKASDESSDTRASNCVTDSLDKRKVKGKILLCDSSDRIYTKRQA
ncbi:hypothetical protein ACH5RR_027517 [Cinchona calisaya]|uniref:Uncharacterized protein n=1 Tax=Cinchona calisaya TaxID=153742 RepID=A0ABD2Z929_9GENT